jgi:cytochrome c-type biogenesis protein CcmH/NrfG
MPEPILVLVALAVAGAAVLLPLRGTGGEVRGFDDELEAAALRHRVALEALRDVEADRRAGSLDDAAYRAQLAEAEARAATTRAALEGRRGGTTAPGTSRGRGAAAVAALAIGAALLVGSVVPASGIANETVVNERLAEARDAETQRQARIAELRDALAADPEDPETLSSLADAHLAGSSTDDLARAAAALQLLIALEPDRADAYERILAAYLRAGDHANARAAWTAYAERPTADPAELAFFDGLIALRGEDDPDRAVEAFDRFLDLAPDDPRAPMVRGLRDDAAGDR